MATSSANDAVIEKLHLLDIEEDQLLQALQLIREQRTAVLESLDRVSTTEARPVTIHSLPPELLTKIFEAACPATIDFGSDDEECSDLAGVPNIVLSQVCHTWRQLAVQTSSLWTRLDLSSPRLVTDCDILRRSGQRMLTVSRTPVIDHFSWSRSLPVLSDIISKTYPRWASLLWYFRTESEVKWLFQLMFEAEEVRSSLRSVYLFCRSRQYGRFSLSIPGQYFVRNPSSWSRPLAQFPFLERVFIHDILLTELSPAMFSSALRQLSIGSSFVTTYTDLGFSVSRLCYLLRPATGLEEISLIGCIPDWDVCLDISQRSPSHKIDREALMPTHRGHNIVIPALELHNLRVLDWDSAPYKDFPRILHLFGCNRLESLTLQLVVQKKQLWRMEPWCTQIVDRQFSLPYLHTLSVSTLDSQLFTGALKNLDCLDLNVLEIRCGLGGLATRAEETSSQHAQRTLSNFPPSDSLFHEPRMTRSLKQFEIFGANIDPMKLRAVMMYMPSLESLSLEKCTGAGSFVCLLSGAMECRSPTDIPRTWICPRLTTLKLVECHDVKFGCLADMILARKSYASAPRIETPRRRTVPLPARRRVLARGIDVQDTPSTSPRINPKFESNVENTIASPSKPNGSLISGWSAHEPVRPSRVEVIHAVNCKRIAEVELVSLKSATYGVQDVLFNR